MSFYEQGGERVYAGLALFDLEWTNIQAGHAWAVRARRYRRHSGISLCDDYPADASHLPLRQHPA